jgi:hypothetical protein
MGKEFQGVVDRETNECLYFVKTSIGGAQKADIVRKPLREAPPQVLEELELMSESFECSGANQMGHHPPSNEIPQEMSQQISNEAADRGSNRS